MVVGILTRPVFHGANGETATLGAGRHVGPQAFVKLEFGEEDGSGIEIPIDSATDDGEPVVVEHVRIRPEKGHTTSRHYRVVKQGDRVLAVIKDRFHDQALTGLNQKDFDRNSPQ